jgi:predicted Rossmann fold nucleotide-binding protein DprA/Smf involved in DNA uptake
MPKKTAPVPTVRLERTNRKIEAEIVSLAGLDLDFSAHRVSPYRELLEKLLDAGKDSALRVANPKARYSIVKAARALGWKVAFAIADGALYAKIVGVANQTGRSVSPASPAAVASDLKWILKALTDGPLTAREIARQAGADTAACEAALAQLMKDKKIEVEDGIYRLAVRKAIA